MLVLNAVFVDALLSWLSLTGRHHRTSVEGLEVGADGKEEASNITCIQNTGTSCLLEACDAARGAARCSAAQCFCAADSCASADGHCYPTRNRAVATSFRLRNVRWPDFYMYFTQNGDDLFVTTSHGGADSAFSLYQLPGPQVSNASEFLLVSARESNSVASVAEVQTCHGGGAVSDSSYGRHVNEQTCKTSLTARTLRIKSFMETSVADLAVKVVAAPGSGQAPNAQAIMVESWAHPGHYLSIGRFFYSVTASFGDPGAGGYWMAEPPLSLTPATFGGRHCAWDCGGYGSGSSLSGLLSLR